MSRRRFHPGLAVRLAAVGALLAAAVPAAAYGPEGHLIAGRVAEPLLCARAAAIVAELGGGEDLGEIGLWADRIRSIPAYADAAAWHYVNVADGESLRDLPYRPEGDVLWAIAHFSARLSDPELDAADRAEALRFLTHFIVDLHQPLHVGLEEDRGGNSIELRFRGEATNLHRFWDTHAIEWVNESVREYTAKVQALAAELGSVSGGDLLDWAGESLALRPDVYAFGDAEQTLSPAYSDRAAQLTRERLALAALRLAATLNALLCE